MKGRGRINKLSGNISNKDVVLSILYVSLRSIESLGTTKGLHDCRCGCCERSQTFDADDDGVTSCEEND